jgi:transcription antitermination factor NusG
MVRRLRRDAVRRRDIDCPLKGACVYPQCTCPQRPETEAQEQAPPHVRGKVVYRSPAGPHVPRKRRPKGWSPLSDWVLVRTKTRHEHYAAMQCRNQDMETYLPRYIEPGKGTPQALFPGYLFVRPGDRWQKLRNTLGVIDIVMMGGNPDLVPTAVLKALRANSDKNGIVTLPSQRKPEIGEVVEIKVGAWQGFKGLYDGLSPEGRLKVLFAMFGKTVTLEFRRESSIEVIIG